MELTVKWPVPFVDLQLLHKMFLNSTNMSYQLIILSMLVFRKIKKSFGLKRLIGWSVWLGLILLFLDILTFMKNTT